MIIYVYGYYVNAIDYVIAIEIVCWLCDLNSVYLHKYGNYLVVCLDWTSKVDTVEYLSG